MRITIAGIVTAILISGCGSRVEPRNDGAPIDEASSPAPNTSSIVPTPASSPTQAADFNLNCTGKYTTGIGVGGGHTYDVRFVVKISLSRSRWCRDKCETTQPIISVADNEIVLLRGTDESIGVREDATINRETGVFASTRHGSDHFIDDIYGTCVKAPFTGMPAQKF